MEEACGFLGSSSEAPRPVTLIQGPPGTGKTHTVCGILNVWHLVQYQRHYKSLEAFLVHPAVASRALGSLSAADQKDMGTEVLGFEAQAKLVELMHECVVLECRGLDIAADADRGLPLGRLMDEARAGRTRPLARGSKAARAPLPVLQPKPKILVCAPSNAATDELLGRVMLRGFQDLEGSPYFPNCLRVGNSEARLDAKARMVLVETMLDEWLGMEAALHDTRLIEAQILLASACGNLLRHLDSIASGTARKSLGPEMVRQFSDLDRAWCELRRLAVIRVRSKWGLAEPRQRVRVFPPHVIFWASVHLAAQVHWGAVRLSGSPP